MIGNEFSPKEIEGYIGYPDIIPILQLRLNSSRKELFRWKLKQWGYTKYQIIDIIGEAPIVPTLGDGYMDIFDYCPAFIQAQFSHDEIDSARNGNVEMIIEVLQLVIVFLEGRINHYITKTKNQSHGKY